MVRRTRIVGALVLAGVFLLGALTGAAGMYARDVRRQAVMIGPGGLAERRGGFIRRLGLSAEQARQVDAVFERHRAERERLREQVLEDCGEPLREHAAGVDAEIRALLDPEQQRRFDRLRQERSERGIPGFGPGPAREGFGRGRRGGRRGAGPRGPTPPPDAPAP